MQKKIRQTILYWLSRRDYSQHEIRQKLTTKGYTPEDITPVLSVFLEEGLINESRYAENLVHWRRNKGYGPLRVNQQLKAKGIPDEIIAEHLQITDNAWATAARQIWRKHFKGKLPKEYKERAKQIRFLQYRGFTRAHIESVLVEVEEFED